MNLSTAAEPGHTPIEDFSQCHAGILGRLHSIGELPALLEPAVRARRLAADTVAFFRDVVMEHHAEEEGQLFPAVLASAEQGAELDKVRQRVDALIAEHRQVEAAWARLEPKLKAVAKGHDADVNPADIATLVKTYEAHARFEEAEFLPLAKRILERNALHMEALSLALHAKHALPEVMRRVGRVF